MTKFAIILAAFCLTTGSAFAANIDISKSGHLQAGLYETVTSDGYRLDHSVVRITNNDDGSITMQVYNSFAGLEADQTRQFIFIGETAGYPMIGIPGQDQYLEVRTSPNMQTGQLILLVQKSLVDVETVGELATNEPALVHVANLKFQSL